MENREDEWQNVSLYFDGFRKQNQTMRNDPKEKRFRRKQKCPENESEVTFEC